MKIQTNAKTERKSIKGEYNMKILNTNNQNEEIKELGQAYMKILKENKNLIVNEEQIGKFNYAKGFFCKYIKENGGKLKEDLNPNDYNAGLTVTMPVMHFYDVDLRRFNNVVKFSTAITFDATADGQVCISLTIPNVFIQRNK